MSKEYKCRGVLRVPMEYYREYLYQIFLEPKEYAILHRSLATEVCNILMLSYGDMQCVVLDQLLMRAQICAMRRQSNLLKIRIFHLE